MTLLSGCVALVTGATRGAGRGIAIELGATGAIVYVTGRSVDGKAGTDALPGTIHATARDVTSAGGVGIAIRCDHTNDAEVDALFDQIARTSGRLDLLVNNVWGGYEHPECRPLSMEPFWTQSLAEWNGMFTASVRAHLMASRRAVPLMLPQKKGLIVSTTATLDGTGRAYLGNLLYDLSKNAVCRMAWGMAHELREHGIASVALAPGFMRTERVVEAFRRAGAEAALDGPGGPSETTAYLGRTVAALASDPNVMNRTGQLLEVGVLAREYGFTDVNGTQPPPFRVSAA